MQCKWEKVVPFFLVENICETSKIPSLIFLDQRSSLYSDTREGILKISFLGRLTIYRTILAIDMLQDTKFAGFWKSENMKHFVWYHSICFFNNVKHTVFVAKNSICAYQANSPILQMSQLKKMFTFYFSKWIVKCINQRMHFRCLIEWLLN